MSSTAILITLYSVPLWVWPLLAILVTVGLMASRERSMKTRVFWFLPLIGLMTIPTLVQIGLWGIIPLFALAYAIGALLGRAFQRRVVISGNSQSVQLRGEWITMVTVMALFFANFAFGTLNALGPELAKDPAFLIPFVGLIGVCSGSFFGRSIYIIGSYRAAKTVA